MATERNTRVRATQIQSILPNDIEATNAKVNGYIPSYNESENKFTWVLNPTSLPDLDDVDFDSGTPADDYILRYDSGTGKWKAENANYTTLSEWGQNGFENRTDSTLTWTDSTPDRTLSIQPASSGSTFDYWIEGIKYTSSGDTVQITNVEGIHIIYYEGSTLTALANPTSTQVSTIIRTKAWVSTVYWDTSATTAIYVGEERHGKSMSPVTHNYLHFTRGLQYLSGLGLNTISSDGSGVTADAQFGVDAGSVTDEDIYHVISAITSTTGLPIYYMLGAGAEWQKYIESGFSVRTFDGTSSTKLSYNQYTGGAWQLTEVGSNDFVLCHVFATTEKDSPMISIMGQDSYSNIAQARAGAEVEIRELVLNDILFPETHPIATLIFQTNLTYANAVNGLVRTTAEGDDYIDWRNEVISRTEIGTSSHNTLTGLQGGTLNEYYHLNSADYTELTEWLDNVTLGSDGTLTLPNGTGINEFSTDGTFAGDSDDAVPTEKAIKTYVDGVAGVSNLADLNDVSFDSGTPTNAQVLTYNASSGKWKASASGGLTSDSVDNFTIKFESNKLKVADRIELNILLLGFYRAVDNSKSKYDLIDGLIDEYEDETGIDTASSLNEDYDSANNLYTNDKDIGGITVDTKLMIHGNDGDSSGNAHVMTYNQSSKIDATTYKWGTGSLWLDGNNDDITSPDSADWDVVGSNSDDWTIDFWVKHRTTPSGTDTYIIQYETNSNFWNIYGTASGLNFLVRSSATGNRETGFGTGISDTNWHHVAMCKVASEYGMYLDGTQINYLSNSAVDTFAGALQIGAWSAGAYIDANFDGMRIQQSNIFSASPNSTPDDTITIPTSAPTADGNTKLLLNFEEGDIYGGHDIEPQGTSYVDKTTYKWGTGSWKFDGNSDYLESPDSADWDVVGSNSDDWTIDFWVKHTDHVGTEVYIQQREDGSNFWTFVHVHGSGLRFYVNSGGGTIIDTGSAGEITDTNWHHVAMCKVSDEYGIYLDGTQISYVQDSSTDTFSGSMYIGAGGAPGDYFDGYMDEMRVQDSNWFTASPTVGLTDTITVPSAEYSESTEVFNMTLISEATVAEADPDTARLVFFEEDVDAVTLNTDLKGWVSKDGGSTWAQVTLADDGSYNGSQRILSGIVDLTASGIGSGTSMKYKATTHNNKELKLHGTGVNWD